MVGGFKGRTLVHPLHFGAEVLVAGGQGPQSVLTSNEIWSLSTGRWVPASPLQVPRISFQMVKLRDGRREFPLLAFNSTASSTHSMHHDQRYLMPLIVMIALSKLSVVPTLSVN